MIVCATRMAFISIPAKHNWPSQNGRLGKYSRFVVAVPKFHWARFMCAPLVWFGLCGTSLATNTIVFRMVFFLLLFLLWSSIFATHQRSKLTVEPGTVIKFLCK